MSHSLVCTPVVAVLCRARVHSPYVYPPSTQRRTMSVSRRSRTTARNKHQPDLEIAGSARMKRRYAHDGIHIRHPPFPARHTTYLGGTPVQFCSGRSMRGRAGGVPDRTAWGRVCIDCGVVTVHGQAVVMDRLAYFGIRRADRALATQGQRRRRGASSCLLPGGWVDSNRPGVCYLRVCRRL